LHFSLEKDYVKYYILKNEEKQWGEVKEKRNHGEN